MKVAQLNWKLLSIKCANNNHAKMYIFCCVTVTNIYKTNHDGKNKQNSTILIKIQTFRIHSLENKQLSLILKFTFLSTQALQLCPIVYYS